ncbi:MAG: hypothetical protein AAGF04_03715 [Chlamydiota bacterium]
MLKNKNVTGSSYPYRKRALTLIDILLTITLLGIAALIFQSQILTLGHKGEVSAFERLSTELRVVQMFARISGKDISLSLLPDKGGVLLHVTLTEMRYPAQQQFAGLILQEPKEILFTSDGSCLAKTVALQGARTGAPFLIDPEEFKIYEDQALPALFLKKRPDAFFLRDLV